MTLLLDAIQILLDVIENLTRSGHSVYLRLLAPAVASVLIGERVLPFFDFVYRVDGLFGDFCKGYKKFLSGLVFA